MYSVGSKTLIQLRDRQNIRTLRRQKFALNDHGVIALSTSAYRGPRGKLCHIECEIACICTICIPGHQPVCCNIPRHVPGTYNLHTGHQPVCCNIPCHVPGTYNLHTGHQPVCCNIPCSIPGTYNLHTGRQPVCCNIPCHVPGT